VPRGRRSPGRPSASPVENPGELRSLVQQFVRSIGLLAGDRTPCGKPLAVSHAHALMVLLEHRKGGGPMTQRALGDHLGIDKSNVARLAERLERAGHLKQERDPGDGRARLLTLTSAGAALAVSVESTSRARFEELFRLVPGPQRPGVLAGLKALNRAVLAADAQGRSGVPARAQARRRRPPGPGRVGT